MTLLRDESFDLGAPPPNPRDLSPSRQNDDARRQIAPPPLIPAAESALGLRPRSALSSAQFFPEWITLTSPCNDLSANGDNPLTSCLTPGVQFRWQKRFRPRMDGDRRVGSVEMGRGECWRDRF
jgi:hypothetical protein